VSAREAPRVVMLGATSAIAEATLRLYAAEGARLTLVGRRKAELERIAADLTARGARSVAVEGLDLVAEADRARDWLTRFAEAGGGVDHIHLAYGSLGSQAEAETDLATARAILDTNFTSAALWCLAAAELLGAQGRGSLVVIGSVAGDRGRASNFVYGAAKAGLGVLVQGLSHRFAGTPVRVVLVKPGFVDTPMTEGMAKGGPLWASADRVAAILRRAADQGPPIVYAPWFWRGVMLAIRSVPAPLFAKLRI
jgi:decaprenylphospho-beta-D-erythro-pentofuranosid-2-ulose 2-reductase